jgi:hypothetical protein
MKRLRIHATTLTTLKKVAFTLLCCSVLMVFGASAQAQTPSGPRPGVPGPPSQANNQPTKKTTVRSLAAAAQSYDVSGTWVDSYNYVWTLTENPSTGAITGTVVGCTPDGTVTGTGTATGAQFTLVVTDTPSCLDYEYDMTWVSPTSAQGTWFDTCNGSPCGSSGSVTMNLTNSTAAATLTVNLLDSGTGTVTDSNEVPTINCSEASGTVTGTCSASYRIGTQVILTATPNSPSPSTPPSTFAGWGGACSGTGSCIVTMNSAQNVTASFDIQGQTVTQTVNTDTQATFPYNGGYAAGGSDYIAQLTSGTSVTASVTEITFPKDACNSIFTNTPFNGAKCFVSQAGTDTATVATVAYELTCPGYSGTNGTCGSDSIANFFATLGSDFHFSISDGSNPGLGETPNKTLTYYQGNPLVGFLKYVGPDPLHPCTLPLVSVSNQIGSFTYVDPGALPVKGTSGGTGSCWLATYNTPDEAPTVAVAAPANNGVYLQNSATIADYTCTTVYNGVNTPTGGTYPPYTATGPYLTGTCSAIDSPGGPVGQGAQFDTATPGQHTFTATVLDSAANTASQMVTYYVQGSQTINFPAIPTQTYGAGPLALNATASSGLPVTYAVTSGPATVVGNMLTITGVGSVTVMASQAGDNSNAPATASQTFGVIAASTTTTVTSSLNPSVYGQAVTFTARVTGAGNPAGSVTWSANTGCGATALSAGAATCTTSSLTLGTNVVMATYSGDTNHVASSGTLNQVVSGPQLTLSPTSINFGNVYLFNIGAKALTLKNTGNATLQISGVSLTFGQADHDFGFINTCPASLAPGKSCIIYLGFWADQLGTQTGTLVITDNAPGSPQQVAITGNGIKR